MVTFLEVLARLDRAMVDSLDVVLDRRSWTSFDRVAEAFDGRTYWNYFAHCHGVGVPPAISSMLNEEMVRKERSWLFGKVQLSIFTFRNV